MAVNRHFKEEHKKLKQQVTCWANVRRMLEQGTPRDTLCRFLKSDQQAILNTWYDIEQAMETLPELLDKVTCSNTPYFQ